MGVAMFPSDRGGIILKFRECTKVRVVPVLGHGVYFFFKIWTSREASAEVA